MVKGIKTLNESHQSQSKYNLLFNNNKVSVVCNLNEGKPSSYSIFVHNRDKIGLCLKCTFRDLKPASNVYDMDDPYYLICAECLDFQYFTTEPMENIEIPQWHEAESIYDAIRQEEKRKQRNGDDPAYHDRPSRIALEKLNEIDFESCDAQVKQWIDDVNEKIELLQENPYRYYVDDNGDFHDCEEDIKREKEEEKLRREEEMKIINMLSSKELERRRKNLAQWRKERLGYFDDDDDDEEYNLF